MPFIEWGEDYKTGIAMIDEQHKKIVDKMNVLAELFEQKANQEALFLSFSELRSFMKTHFASEEHLMRLYNYPDYEAHKVEHETFVKKTDTLKKDLRRKATSLGMQELETIRKWFRLHVERFDNLYGPHILSRLKPD